VIHYDPAEDHKAYLHRSGRTARAGKTGVAVSLVLWDQEREIEGLQKRLGINQPLVEVFSNDDRLKDLAAWDPAGEFAAEIEAIATGTDHAAATPTLSPSEIVRARRAAAAPTSRRRRRML
jgi:superfamily II DNA/RNA helicase